MTRFGTLFQQDFSLLTSSERVNPINPTRRVQKPDERGIVMTAGRPMRVELPRYWSSDDLANQPNATIDGWNATKRQGGHECAAMEMGEFCTHAVAAEPTRPQPSPQGPVTSPTVVVRRVG